MNKKILIAICLFVQTAFLIAQSYDITKPLPVDKEFIVGKLENGLTYYIRESNLSKDKADFFIIHNVGSLQEDENQRGLAHFLEHMAFNGTKHFPGNSLINYFESIGVRFGTNVNAYTSMSRTVYNISEVPIKRSTVIDSTLLALHDWSHYIDCLPKEIEKERGVVREEMRLGDEPINRMQEAINEIQQKGSRFAVRKPIGLAKVVENFNREELIDFYHKWYRPNEQAVVVVGDIDAKDIEKRIKERFSAISNPEEELEKLYYSIPENSEPIVDFFVDPEIASKSVRMTIKIPHRSIAEKQTYAFLYDELLDDLFLEMFKSRTLESAEKADAGFRVLIPIYSEIDYACKTFTATAIPAHGKDLYASLKDILEEVERARQHGMTELELDHAKRIVRANIHKRQSKIKQRGRNRNIVNIAVDNFTRNEPLVDESEYLELALSVLEKVTIDEVNSNIERVLNKNNRVIIFIAPESEKESLPSAEKVLSLVELIQNTCLEKYIPKSKKELVFNEKIKVGEILESRNVTSKDLGIDYKVPLDSTTEFKLKNGARVLWKESYGDGDKVSLSAIAPGGYARSQSIENIMILKNYMKFFSVANLNWNELNEWKLANGIVLNNKIDKVTDNYSGDFHPDNSESFFKILYLYFTDVSADKTELARFQRRYLESLKKERNDDRLYQDSIKTIAYSSNLKKTNIDSTLIKGLTLDKIDELYKSHFSNPNEFTFIFVGPMSVDSAKPLIEKYIASIPIGNISGEKELVCKEPILEKGNIEFYYDAKNTITSKASVSINYHAPIEYNTENYVNNLFLQDILFKRLHKSIREDKGGTYYVSVTSTLERYPNPYIVVEVNFDTRPSMIAELMDIAQYEVDLLLKDGPTEQEIEEAKKFRLKKMDNDKNNPWIDIITQSISNELFVDTSDPCLINQVSTSSVYQLIKTLFTSGNKMSFVFDPQTSIEKNN